MEPPEANEEELLTRRIHILGMGSIGCLAAHSFRTIPNPPPVTLMHHRESMYADFRNSGSVIRLFDPNSDINDAQQGFDLDVKKPNRDGLPVWSYHPAWTAKNQMENPRKEAEVMENDETFIYNLVVTVKAQLLVASLKNVRHRLDARSTICLLQNGLGQIDELNSQVFIDVNTRPTYLIGVVSHGCYMKGPVTVVHAGFGATALGIYRDTEKYPLPPKDLSSNLSDLTPEQRTKHYPTDAELYSTSLSARYLLRTLTRTSTLACAAYPYLDLLQLQLEKLSSNALVNPLTSLFDVPNGYMLENSHLSTIHNMLITEISLIIRALPELQSIPAVHQRFSPERLRQLFTGVVNKTAQNSSSMREDIRKARPHTEIDYINGYIVKRGQEVGIQAAVNFMVVQMVKAKNLFAVRTGFNEIPFASQRVEGTVDEERRGEPGSVVLEDRSGEKQRSP